MGRFYLAVVTEDKAKHVIFDVRNTTHHPDDPAPDGFVQFNPLKMYTHRKNVDRVRQCGGALKIAFLIGFNIYLPFIIIDIVVSSVTISMGMLMLPPAMISLPFKLMLFVLVDGWHLVLGMLLESFTPYT